MSVGNQRARGLGICSMETDNHGDRNQVMREKQRILIVDDEVPFRRGLTRLLVDEHEVYEAGSGEEAVRLASRYEPDLVLLDIGLPDANGLELLSQLKDLRPSPVVVMVTAYEQVKDVVLAMRRGAYDYLVKPVDLEEFELTVQHALEHALLKNEVSRLRRELHRLQGVERLIGKNRAFLDAQVLAVKSAQSPDACVLLQGESGVGKELFARLIHAQSPRVAFPFVALNCAAFSQEIIESELFGYEKGAFTGARSEGKAGLLEVAQGGTLFLDEVVDLSPEIQAKLLRVLEEKEFYPLGGTRKRSVNIRIVSACNRDLWDASLDGQFRKDLFFRLATIRIQIPPLRERRDDVLPLTQYFLEQFNDKYSKKFRGLSPEAESILISYQWPGNVRELRNAIERVVLLEDDDTLLAEHLHFLLPPETETRPRIDPLHVDLPEEGFSLEEWETELIRRAYDKCGRNKSRAARYLGLPRHVLLYRLKKYGIT